MEKSQTFLENVATLNVDLFVRKQGNHRLMKPRDLTLVTYVIDKLIKDIEKMKSKVWLKSITSTARVRNYSNTQIVSYLVDIKSAIKSLSFLCTCLLIGVFTNYVDKFLSFFDHLTPYVDIFYLINVDKKSWFLDYLPTSYCQHSSLWTPHYHKPILNCCGFNFHFYFIHIRHEQGRAISLTHLSFCKKLFHLSTPFFLII